jgi:hypothetical protein
MGFIIQSVKHIHKISNKTDISSTEWFALGPLLEAPQGGFEAAAPRAFGCQTYICMFVIFVYVFDRLYYMNFECRAEGAAIMVFSSVLQEYFIENYTEYIIGNLPCRAFGAAIRVFSSVIQEYFI